MQTHSQRESWRTNTLTLLFSPPPAGPPIGQTQQEARGPGSILMQMKQPGRCMPQSWSGGSVTSVQGLSCPPCSPDLLTCWVDQKACQGDICQLSSLSLKMKRERSALVKRTSSVNRGRSWDNGCLDSKWFEITSECESFGERILLLPKATQNHQHKFREAKGKVLKAEGSVKLRLDCGYKTREWKTFFKESPVPIVRVKYSPMSWAPKVSC